MVSYVKLLS